MRKNGLNIYHRKDDRWGGRYKEWIIFKKTKVKESTISNYEFKVNNHIIPFFGGLKINQISSECVYNFINLKTQEGLSAHYISDIIVVLKNIIKYAVRTYHYADPLINIELPKNKNMKSEMKLFSKDQQIILKRELQDNINLTKLGIMLCLYSGIRIGELCSLMWSDFNFQEGTININKTCQRIRINQTSSTKLIITSPKSVTSVRIIPLPDFIINLLKEFVPSDISTYFLSSTNKIVEPRNMQYHFNKLLKRIQLPHINFHALRHMFATSCIEAGFD